MGGLFSSENERRPTPAARSYQRPTPVEWSYYHYEPPSRSAVPSRPTVPSNQGYSTAGRVAPQPTPRQYSYDDYLEMQRRLASLSLRNQNQNQERVLSSRRIQEPERSQRNTSLFDIYDVQVVRFTQLFPHEPEYFTITRMITNKKNFKVDSIERIENPFLEKAYELKKAQKSLQYDDIQERLLFHGTKHANMDAICTHNFDWRQCKAHKYGKGVSFSPNSTYASVYSDAHVYNKVMIVAKVLIGRSCAGNKFMELPLQGCDTSHKEPGGVVIVKYEDNDFCPVFKINYHLIDENVGKRNNYKKRGGHHQRLLHFNNNFYDDLI